MPAYAIVATDITDEKEFDIYAELASDVVAEFGGEFLARTSEQAVKEGHSRMRTTLVKFPDMATAEAFYASPGYQNAFKHVTAGAVSDYKLVPGL